MNRKIQAAMLSLTLLLPSSAAFARTHHYQHHKHHSQARGALIGGAAGALLGHGPRSALVGAGVGWAVQHERNKH
jgi:uncharacterized membrane protein YfcA